MIMHASLSHPSPQKRIDLMRQSQTCHRERRGSRQLKYECRVFKVIPNHNKHMNLN